MDEFEERVQQFNDLKQSLTKLNEVFVKMMPTFQDIVKNDVVLGQSAGQAFTSEHWYGPDAAKISGLSTQSIPNMKELIT